MKIKLKDLDNIDTKILNKLTFNNYEEVEQYLKNTYCDNYKDIKETIKPFSLSDTLDYLNLEIMEI